MPNKTLAEEWLVKAYHNLSSAQILYAANHYTDIIGLELQQAIEKSLKSFLAYNNNQIKKTHDLIDVCELVTGYIQFEEFEIDLLDIATNYYTQNRYPTPHPALPPRKEIKEVLDFAEDLFEKVCRILDIDKQKVGKK